ncbi:MAG: ABC transporter ATP-binding protein [Spirochaetales bacterium]|nr:ABC transporter ATP-binding protein [Spirochaetales bacterium]
MISIRHLSYSLGGRFLLYDIDLTLSLGSISLLQGANGAGKSTLLKAMLLPDLFPDVFLLGGRPLRHYSDCQAMRSRCGYLGHEPGLYLDLTAVQNLNFFLGLCGQKISRKALLVHLEEAGLEGTWNRPVRYFSRGMQQRLGFLRLFLCEPDFLFIDEPLNSLDRSGVSFFLNCLQRWKREDRLALLVSHSDEELLPVVDRFLFMRNGQLVADLKKEQYTAAVREKAFALIS